MSHQTSMQILTFQILTFFFFEFNPFHIFVPFLFGNWEICDDLSLDVCLVAEPFCNHEYVGFQVQAYHKPVPIPNLCFGCDVRTRLIPCRLSVLLHPDRLLLWVESFIETVVHKLLLLFSWCDAYLSWLLDHLIERNWKKINYKKTSLLNVNSQN